MNRVRLHGRVWPRLEGPRRNWLRVYHISFRYLDSPCSNDYRASHSYTDDKLVNFNITSGVRNFLVSILTVIVPKRHIPSSYSIPTQQFVVSYTLLTNKEFLSKYWGPRAKQTTRFPQDFQLLHVSLWSSKAVYLSSRFSEESGKLTNTKSYKLVRYFLYSTNVLPYFQNFELIRKRIAHKAKDWINVRTCPRVCKTCTYV